MTYKECFVQGQEILTRAEVPEAALDARLLLEYVCGTNRNDLLVHGDREVSAEQWKQYEEFLQQRGRRIPLQHILGTQEFMGLTFRVSDKVLIPRQDTEILVEEVLKDLGSGMRILDMCTGSGCILLSLLHYSNDCTGVGADISPEALEVAERNGEALSACQNDAEDGYSMEFSDKAPLNYRFIRSDLFEQVEGIFDVIVSNPPYIPTDVIETLMPEVRDYEPMLALDGTADGLFFYRKLAQLSPAYLNRGGRLYLEIGCEQAEAVSGLLQAAGFADIKVTKDYAGLERVVSATYLECR